MSIVMHVFAWEALTAGLWPDAPASMLREGRAMLRALAEDLRRVKDCRVSTIPPASDESALFDRLAAEADLCWLIAPETDGLLAERCRRVESLGGTLAGPSSAAVELCGDKLALARFLESHRITTISTMPFDRGRIPSATEFPLVVKPRIGAGSDGVRLLAIAADASCGMPPFNEKRGALRGFVQQPLQRGLAVSVAAIVRPAGIEILPVARQLLSDDGTFAYFGGEVPVETSRTQEIRQLVTAACERIDGLCGYVGFDLIVPENAAEPVLIVEINPRLTTSYVGYRRLAEDNITERILCRNDPQPIRWSKLRLRYFPDGRCIEANAVGPTPRE